MICQLRKYIEQIYVDVTILFNENPRKDLKFFLKIMEILITKGNLTLMLKEAMDEHLNLSRKQRHLNDDKQFKFLQEGSNKILSKVQIIGLIVT